MSRWLILTLALSCLVACGGSRDRSSGTRNGPGAPSGSGTPDAGVVVDSDGSVTVPADGGAPVDAGGPLGDGGGGGGGELPPPATLLTELSPDDLDAVCRYIVERQGSQPVTCEGEIEISPTSYDACIMGAINTGTCNVGQLVDCMDTLDGDLCNLFVTEACQILLACSSE